MAKDPKNFTGENVPALLAEYDRHERAKEGRWMVWVFGWAMVPVVVFLGAIVVFIASLLR